MFAHIYTYFPERFKNIFLGGSDGASLENFWSEVCLRRDPRMRFHPMVNSPQWKKRAVPLSVHGDAVPCVAVGKAGTKSFDVCSFQGLLGHGTTKELKLLIFGIFEHTKTADGMSAIWKDVMWSFEHLNRGEWPAGDPKGRPWPPGSLDAIRAGQPLAGGHFGVVWGLKADLNHLSKAWGLKHYNSNTPCELCRCNRSEEVAYRFNNFRKDAAWKTSLVSAEDWKAENPTPHAIFSFEYLSNQNIEVDELHVMHLGTSQYLFGSVRFVLCFEILQGDPASNMRQVWQEISKAYTDFKSECQYTNLELSSFCDHERPLASYPKLKGKGAEAKDLAAPLLAVWKKLKRQRNKLDDITQRALGHQVALQQVLSEYTCDPFLPMDKVATFRDHIDGFLQNYTLLANDADSRGLLRWNIAPKFHYLWHLGEISKYLNPRRGNTMMDEGFVGVIKEIVRACAHGTESHNVPRSVVYNYRWGLHFLSVYGDTFQPAS